MAIPRGRFRSPVARRRTLRFLQQRNQTLDRFMPNAQMSLEQIVREPVPQPRSPILDQQAQAFRGQEPQGFRRPQAGQLGPAFLSDPRNVEVLNPPTSPFPEDSPGPGFLSTGRRFSQAALDIARKIATTPGAPGTAAIPGVPATAKRRAPSLAEAERAEGRLLKPITEPVSRFATESLVRGAVPVGIPGRERAIELAGRAGEVVGGEVLRPSNLIPIPIIDPAVARLLRLATRGLKTGTRVTPEVIRGLRRELAELVGQEGVSPRLKEAARKADARMGNLLSSERGAAQIPGGGGAPEREVARLRSGARRVDTGDPLGFELRFSDEPAARRAQLLDISAQPQQHGAGALEMTAVNNPTAENVFTQETYDKWRQFVLRATDEELEVAARQLEQGGISRLDARLQQVMERPVRGAEEGLRPIPERVSTEPLAGFEPEPLRVPEGQEAPLFPELERQAAIEADLNEGLEAAFRGDAVLGGETSIGGRDVIGEQLLRDNLPTSADVQRASRSLPPEERAAIAGEAGDVRRPVEDFDVVVAREEGRFRTNVITKLDDFLQPIFGRNRDLQRQVRDIFVNRDIYVGRQAGRLRLAAREWIGRHREALGLVTGELSPAAGRFTGQARRGYALNVQVREGAKIPPKARQHLNDVIEHPEDYIITPEQQVAIDEYNAIFTDMVRAEQRHGVDVNELWEGYAPRIITKAPPGQTLETAVKSLQSRFPATHPWYTKERAIPDVRQLFAAGFDVGDPLSAMEIRLAAGVETIANQRSVRTLQGLGELPSEQIPQVFRSRLRAATETHATARKQALKTGSTSDQAIAEQASVALDQAKRDIRRQGRLFAERLPKVLGRNVKPDVAAEVQKFLQDQGEGALDDIFRVLRTSLVQADYGSLMLQNWTTFFRNNVAWMKAAAIGARSIADAPYDYIVRNADAIDLGLRYGAIQQPEEFLLRRGGKASQLLGKAPIIRESQNIFEWNIFVAQAERWKGVMRLAKSDKELLDLAAVLRKQSGSNFMPGLTRAQAKLMSISLFAPQFTTALLSSVAEPFLRTGVARREAIKSMGMLFGGAAALTVALNQQLNGELPNMTDPDKPGFWAIRVGDGFVFPFGPFQPMIVALARSGRAGNDLAHGRTPSARDAQAWPSFLSNKASIPVRMLQRVAEAMGIPLENIRGPSFGRPEAIRPDEGPLQALRREATEFLPIGPTQAVEGIRQGAPITALETIGGRTTVLSPFSRLIEARQEVAREHGIDPSLMVGDAWEQFKADRPDFKDIIQADPRVVAAGEQVGVRARERFGETPEAAGFEAIKESRATQLEAQLADDRLLNTGTLPGDRWRKSFGDRQQNFFNRREQIVEDFKVEFEGPDARADTIGAAIGAYFAIDLEAWTDPQTRERDWEGYFNARKDALTGLSTADKDAALRHIRKFDTPTVAEFRRAQEKVDQLFKIPKYVGLSLKDGEEVDRILEQAAQFQLEEQRRTGRALERGQVIALMLQQGLVADADVARFIGQFFRTSRRRRLGRRRARTPFSVERDDFIIRNQRLLTRFFPDIVENQLNREQEAGLEEVAFQRISNFGR